MTVYKTMAMALLALAPLSMAHANLIENGSFESPTLSNRWGIVLPTGWDTDLTGSYGPEIQTSSVYPSFDGNQHIELDSHASGPGGPSTNANIFQDVDLVSGRTYELSFAYAGRTGQSASSNGIDVNFGDYVDTNVSSPGQNPIVWEPYSFIFTATETGTERLMFAATGNANTLGGLVDAVSLTVVPEPATMTLLGLGLGGLAVRRFRRKKA